MQAPSDTTAGARTRAQVAGSVAVLVFLQALRGGIERLGRLMGWMAGWLFVVCAFFVTFDVLSRKFLGFSTHGTTEITGYMLAFGITWGLTHTLTMRAHIRVDMLVSRMPLGLRAYMHAVALLFLASMIFFFAWRGWAVVLESWEFGSKDTSALSIPLIAPQGLWAFGITIFFALAVVMLLEVVLLLGLGQREAVDRLLGSRTLEEETVEALEAAGLAQARGPAGGAAAARS